VASQVLELQQQVEWNLLTIGDNFLSIPSFCCCSDFSDRSLRRIKSPGPSIRGHLLSHRRRLIEVGLLAHPI
jgi:hypothetical protein